MAWIFLSPHFDDIALSCGGMVWEKAQEEDAPVWTICGGEPPAGELSAFAEALHTRWQTPSEAVRQRQMEDEASCQLLGASPLHFPIPDCIYRPGGDSGIFYYASEESLFGDLHPAEQPLVERLAQELAQALPENAQVVCPLTLGGHVDHRLTRAAAERLGLSLWYYADYPYALQAAETLKTHQEAGWHSQVHPISLAGLHAWQEAIAAHRSQISTFWPDMEAMRAAIRAYWQAESGIRLWKPV
jgi:LmbE family N-acetylglucosaminyl deacetylase